MPAPATEFQWFIKKARIFKEIGALFIEIRALPRRAAG
jgi:hypothetical protein